MAEKRRWLEAGGSSSKAVDSAEFWKRGFTETIQVIVPEGRTGGLLEGHFTPDGTGVAVMSGLLAATICDVTSGAVVNQIGAHTFTLQSVRFSPDGTRILTLSEDGTAKIFTSRTAPSNDVPTFSNAHADAVYQIDLDQSGKRLLTGSYDGTVRVWDTKTRTSRLLQAHWSPDGRDIITAWSDGSVDVWSGATQEDLASFIGEREDFEEQFDAWRKKTMTSIGP